jgi:hypothetical protein
VKKRASPQAVAHAAYEEMYGEYRVLYGWREVRSRIAST